MARRRRACKPGSAVAKLAESLGAHGERIERPADVASALERASQITMDGRPALLEIMTRHEPALSRFGPRNP